MPYTEFLAELKSNAEESYAAFNRKLLKNVNIKVLGVRVPALRKTAKKYSSRIDELLGFPDEYFEVTFVKLAAVSLLDYGDFIKYADGCVRLIDNWASCDSFAPVCIKRHRDEFLPYVVGYAREEGEFVRRFALTTLLHFYVEEKYLELVFRTLENCSTRDYYVSTAAAWLVAETLVKFYDRAVEFLNRKTLDKATHNKAIVKACESLRLSDEKKKYLKGLKR